MSEQHPGVIVGLSMIVKDEAETIEALLDSVLPHVDRVYILDTGSTDGTDRLVDEASLRNGYDDPETRAVLDATYRPDVWSFGAARQEALDRLLERFPEVTHVVWFDGDDLVVGGENIRELAAQIGPGVAAGMAHYAYATDPWGNLSCSHFRERIVRVDAIDRWANDVHEVLLTHPGVPQIRIAAPTSSGLAAVPNNSWPIAPGGFEVVHRRPPGKDTTGRNRRILEAEVDEAGDDAPARALFYLAQEYAILAAETDASTPEGAEAQAAWLRRAVGTLDRHEKVATWDEERYQARHRKADFLRALGDHDRALAVELVGAADKPSWPDAWLGAAESYVALGNPEAALSYLELGLAKPYPDTPLILNPLDYTFTPLVTAAQANLQLGRLEPARRAAVEAAGMQPGNPAVAGLAAECEEAANRAAVREAVLGLDEALARHDENLKAVDLLERCVPYFLQTDPEIADRRRRRRAGVRHVRGEDQRYGEYYGEDNPVYPITLQFGPLFGYGQEGGPDFPECVRRFCDMLPRAQALLNGLIDQSQSRQERRGGLVGMRVLDLGCNDGWLGWWLSAEWGVEYHGYDLSVEAVATAAGWAEHYPDIESPTGKCSTRTAPVFNLGMEPEAGGAFDAVVCFEVIEHVPDVAEQLRRLARHAAPGGRVYVSTPNGAYERGRIQDWNTPEARGHVRALTAGDVARHVLDIGGHLEAFAETPDGLVVASFTPGAEPLGRVALHLGSAGAETWDPLDSLSKGLGGSETMAVRVATQLAERGWRVTVYANVNPGCVQGVEYQPWWLYDPAEAVDVLICSRNPALATERPNARYRVLWLHDADYPDLQEHAGGWDEVVYVGEWQKQQLGLGRGVVIPNGLPVAARYPDGGRGFRDRKPWVVYSSSPDRGLERLVEVWPRIRGRVPDAQLHVTYGFTATWRMMEEAGAQNLRDLRRHLEDAIAMPGLVWHGGVGQVELARIQQEARVWAYPTDFPEVSCITAMEAQAAGLAIVATDRAELPTTLTDSGAVLFPRAAEWTDATAGEFVDAVVERLLEEDVWTAAHTAARGMAPRFDVELVGAVWHDLLTGALRPTLEAVAA